MRLISPCGPPTVRRVSLALPIDYEEEEVYQSSSSSLSDNASASPAETVVGQSEVPIPPSGVGEWPTKLTDELRKSRFQVTICPEIVVDPPADEVNEEKGERLEPDYSATDNAPSSQEENTAPGARCEYTYRKVKLKLDVKRLWSNQFHFLKAGNKCNHPKRRSYLGIF